MASFLFPNLTTSHGKRYIEHVNPKSYSWCLMRYAIIKLSIYNINQFLTVIGIEPHGKFRLQASLLSVWSIFDHLKNWPRCHH